MYYYKFTDKNGNVTYQAHKDAVSREEMTDITESEYNAVAEELRIQAEKENQESENSKDEYIKALENENAALLYQILTGEELTDAQ